MGFEFSTYPSPDPDIRHNQERQWQAKYGPYLHRTDTIPRPTGDEDQFRSITDPARRAGVVAEAQVKWDAAEAVRVAQQKEAEAFRAKLEADRAADQKKQEAELAARKSAELATVTAQLRERYLAQPGATEDRWEANKETVLNEHFTRGVFEPKPVQPLPVEI